MKKFFQLFTIILATTFTLFIYGSLSAHADTPPAIFIKAISPGYTVDGKSNVGEFVELARSNSDHPISLAGFSISYTNSSGNPSILFEFSEHFWMTGESILLRLAGSSEPASLEYSKTLAMKAGPLELISNGKVIDSVCWTGKDGCAPEFKTTAPTALVRNLETFQFDHLSAYYPPYDPASPGFYEEIIPEEISPSQCKNLEFSEILSFYETARSEQFIEFYNSSTSQILLDGCKLKYKNKLYPLSGIAQPNSYFVYFPTAFSLTKNPTTSNLLEIIDTDDTVIDSLTFFNGQQKATSYIKVGYDDHGAEIWRQTFAPTPNAPNHYQEFRSCSSDKVLNPETGNCVKPTKILEKTCPAGQYLNPLTGRCKSFETASTKTCRDGYFLNPTTGRCKKIITNDGADYALTPETYEEKTSFIALYAVIGIILLGLIYLIYEFRFEIKNFFVKLHHKT